MKYREKWQKDEIEFLVKNYKKYGMEFCQDKLGRTKHAINNQTRRLGIKLGDKNTYRYSEDELRNAIKKSTSMCQVLRNLKMQQGGPNHITLKKYIKIYNIDISHFGQLHPKGVYFPKRPLNELLVANVPYSKNGVIKRRLYDEGLKERKCEECGQGEMWRGKKMSLILDHKNGINNDYRLENLRIVCPNCNATLETHCRGKRGLEKQNKRREKEKQIKDQIEKIKQARKLKSRQKETEIMKIKRKIRNIFRPNKQKIKRPSYSQLKNEVKKSNYCAVGRKYGVSDNSIRMWIKRYERKQWLINKLKQLKSKLKSKKLIVRKNKK